MPYELPADLTLMASDGIGIYSLIAGKNREKRSSWPTWLLVPLVVFLALVLAVQTIPPTPVELRVFEFAIIAFVWLRWLLALILKEKSWGWIFYILVLLASSATPYWMEKFFAITHK